MIYQLVQNQFIQERIPLFLLILNWGKNYIYMYTFKIYLNDRIDSFYFINSHKNSFLTNIPFDYYNNKNINFEYKLL